MDGHTDFARIYAAMAKLTTRTMKFDGLLYRACTPAYANTRDLLIGEGSRRSGGRWNAPGIAVVYLSRSFEGAIAEALGVATHYGFDPAARLPMTLVAVDANIAEILDLTDATVRQALGLTLRQLNHCPWRDENAAGREAVTQTVGRAAQTLGFQGLLVLSSLKRTFRNLNVFPANLRGTGSLNIRSADKLPPPPAPGLF